MVTIHHIFALLVLSGRLSPNEAQAGAALLDRHDLDEPGSVRDALTQLVGAVSAATGKVRVNCPRCDGRGFYRGYSLSEHEGAVVFCDDCDGHGTTSVEYGT